MEVFANIILNARLKKAAKDPSFGLNKFARQVGVSPTYQSHVEHGRCPPPSTKVIRMYAALLDMDYFDLLQSAGKGDEELIQRVVSEPKLRNALLAMVDEPVIQEVVMAVKSMTEAQVGYLGTAVKGILEGKAGDRKLRI